MPIIYKKLQIIGIQTNNQPSPIIDKNYSSIINKNYDIILVQPFVLVGREFLQAAFVHFNIDFHLEMNESIGERDSGDQ